MKEIFDKYLKTFSEKTILIHLLSFFIFFNILISGLSIVGETGDATRIYNLWDIIQIVIISIIIWLLGFYSNKRR